MATKFFRIYLSKQCKDSALWKFHRLTGMLGTDKANLGGMISAEFVVPWGTFRDYVYAASDCKDPR